MSWPFALPAAAVTPRRDATRSGVQQKRPRSPSPSPEPEPDDSECFICADAPACVVLSACGHGGMCEVCCEKWRKAERKAKRSPACALCKTYVLPGACVTAADASSLHAARQKDRQDCVFRYWQWAERARPSRLDAAAPCLRLWLVRLRAHAAARWRRRWGARQGRSHALPCCSGHRSGCIRRNSVAFGLRSAASAVRWRGSTGCGCAWQNSTRLCAEV